MKNASAFTGLGSPLRTMEVTTPAVEYAPAGTTAALKAAQTDLDAYAQALRNLVDAVDHHSTGPLRRELSDALGEARELLGEDRR